MDTSEQDNFIVTHLTDLQGSLRLYIQSLMPGDASCKDQCLDLLRPKHKELILHRYATPHSLKDYSERTGSSVATLKVTLHRLRSTLLACIERKIKPEAGL